MTFQFTSTIHLFDDNLWYYHFLIPREVANELLKLPTQRRVLCSINGQENMHCALMPDGLGDHFINLNQKLRAQLKLSENQVIDVVLKPDDSPFGMDMPVEFEETLRQDKSANEVFQKLTPGKQRNLIYIVNQVKSPAIRLRRALVIADHLINHGKIDFKALHAEIKAANQRANRSS